MNIIEIADKFPTELDAVKYFDQIRWGEKPKCTYCGSERLSKRNKDMHFKCYECKKTSSVTVNTELHGTNMKLKKWLYAFSIISDAKKGVSALQLHRNLDISYPTSLNMYHKIQDLMTIKNKEVVLDGIVEMDETFVGGKPRKWNDGTTTPPKGDVKIPELDERIKELNAAGVDFKPKRGNPPYSAINPKRGRGTKKIPVMGIAERDGDVVAQVIRYLTAKEIQKMMQKYVNTDDAVLITDEDKGYNKLIPLLSM